MLSIGLLPETTDAAAADATDSWSAVVGVLGLEQAELKDNLETECGGVDTHEILRMRSVFCGE